ncbi:hypothetical protein FJT64_012378 [Amphibalanus amphitrite]|uniref:Uncharacterized protein n=1 Tax=Amphibalanus amphitrite TaxID=1232801 RepID=A0A6A4VDN0_AMPAM|nr:uncharacterized protein LOC122388934 [Amphibalanus amphitrite]XP_043244948.1 uncharacterized protein LOC122393189 [Amphibalanus amphitrite]KAF0289360.1 hypothetical protein FJT64_012378 [Amphibalanus amphitrite]KAF0289361.1 hypothetical protein FJT64_012378 [Amphibalanus amphitrite]
MVSPAPAILFSVEVYHCIVHIMVLFAWRQLPRKDLVRARIYFLIDATTVALISYWLLPWLWPLGLLQNIQHLGYFFCWEQTWFAKRVVSWSSLDWDRSRWQPDLMLGTVFDIVVHVVNMTCLYQLLTRPVAAVGVAVACLMVCLVLYNPRLAWTSKGSMPAWVKKRLQPVSREQAGEDHRLVTAMGWAK